jgi:hypothetical protein
MSTRTPPCSAALCSAHAHASTQCCVLTWHVLALSPAAQLTDGAADLVTLKGAPTAEMGALSVNGAAAKAAPPAAAAAAAAAPESDSESDDDSDDDDAAEGDEGEDPLVVKLRAYAAKHSGAATAAKLRGMAAEGPEHRAHVAVSALLSAGEEAAPPIAKQLATRAAALAGAAPDAAGRTALLAALEAFAAELPPAQLKTLPAGLQALYDADVLDEPSLLTWHDNAAAARKFGVSPDDAKAVRKAAFPLIDWLRCDLRMWRDCVSVYVC